MSESLGAYVFHGSRNGLSSGTFIRNVRQEAIAVGKQTDDQWIAMFAASRMDGIALDWYEGLAEEIQESWKLLRRVLLLRWPILATLDTDPADLLSATVPTPAAASPPPSNTTPQPSPLPSGIFASPASGNIFSGRLRVISDLDHGPLYVSSRMSSLGHHTASNIGDALQSWMDPAAKSHEISIVGPSPRFLGVTFDRAKTMKLMGEKMLSGDLLWGGLATVTTIPGSNSSNTSSRYEKSVTVSKVWLLVAGGQELVAQCEIQPGVRVDLDFAISIDSKKVSLTNNLDAVMHRAPSWSGTKVRLVLEPAS